MELLWEWIQKKDKRERSEIAFTAGLRRNIANYIELLEYELALSVSYCQHCDCMTHTINSVYGKLCTKCGKVKIEGYQ